MIPFIRTTVDNGGVAEMTVTGISMKPLLKDRVSSVRLEKADDLEVGDIVLFEKESGHYVLHRISAIHDGTYDIIGDNQYVTDRDIPAGNIIARVSEYNRSGKHWRDSDRLYRVVLPVIKSSKFFLIRVKRKAGAGLRRLRKLVNKT